MLVEILLSPIGKILTVTLVSLTVGWLFYREVTRTAREAAQARLQAEELKRISDAVRAGDAVDVSGDRLLADDGHRRD